MTHQEPKMTLEDLIPVFKMQMSRQELIRAADWLIEYAPEDSLRQQLQQREEEEMAERPCNASERCRGVVTYNN